MAAELYLSGLGLLAVGVFGGQGLLTVGGACRGKWLFFSIVLLRLHKVRRLKRCDCRSCWTLSYFYMPEWSLSNEKKRKKKKKKNPILQISNKKAERSVKYCKMQFSNIHSQMLQQSFEFIAKFNIRAAAATGLQITFPAICRKLPKFGTGKRSPTPSLFLLFVYLLVNFFSHPPEKFKRSCSRPAGAGSEWSDSIQSNPIKEFSLRAFILFPSMPCPSTSTYVCSPPPKKSVIFYEGANMYIPQVSTMGVGLGWVGSWSPPFSPPIA